MKNKITLIFLITLAIGSFSLQAKAPSLFRNADKSEMNEWVDSVFTSLTPDERIGQLFVMTVKTGDWQADKNQLTKLIKKYKIGGVLFSHGLSEEQAQLTNYGQSISKVPLLITLDGEWGLSMRLKDTPRFPVNMMLGAIQDDRLIYEYGREVGRQCRRMGIHINFAPVLDVNSNPLNPVIGRRSFGEDPEMVARKAITYAKGLESAGIMAVAKHFPGHGDTSEDSHKTLPEVNLSKARLENCEILPFKRYIDAGLSGIMVGHLNIPALDNSTGLPTSLSPQICTELLQKKLGFKGIIFTDALAMKGASNQPSAALKSLIAGNDLALNPSNIASQINDIKDALKNGTISQDFIDEKCKKVLQYKFILGLNHYTPVETENLINDLNSPEAELINRKLNAAAITLIKNQKHLIPYKDLANKSIALVTLGNPEKNEFFNTLQNYAPVSWFNISEKETKNIIEEKIRNIRRNNRVIIAVHNDKADRMLLREICNNKDNVSVVFFINPYQMASYKDVITNASAILLAYENTSLAQEYAAQVLFGGSPATGKIPVTLSGLCSRGTGELTQVIRLGYSIPEDAGLNSSILSRVDSIIEDGISKKAFPGAQLLIARHGKIICDRAYGYFEYDKKHKIERSDIYDLASVSKAAGTLPAVMKAWETHHIALDKPLSHYIPQLKNSDKKEMTVREALYHETGMPAALNTTTMIMDPSSYQGVLIKRKRDSEYPIKITDDSYGNKNAHIRSDLVARDSSTTYPVKLAHHFYGTTALHDSVMNRIYTIPLKSDKNYRYSCLNFILLQNAVENSTGQKIDSWLKDEIFSPLEAYHMTYRPGDHIALDKIAPTENDPFVRKQIMHGYVHDETACLLGGISGNAGLFSNAGDLAKLCQMWLNGGDYAGEQILSEKTVRLFLSSKSPNSRRGLGFDKPDMENPGNSPTCSEANAETVGHLGFTGTCFWIDPKEDLIYIFLCNRVNPCRTPNTLGDLNIRVKLFSEIYHSIIEPHK